MVAIARAESGWADDARGDTPASLREAGYYAAANELQPYACPPGDPNGTTAWGLWQVNASHRTYLTAQTGSTSPCDWAQWLYVPVNCAQAANALLGSNPQAGLDNWTTYTGGAWLRYVSDAQQAIAAVVTTTTQKTGGGVLSSVPPAAVSAGAIGAALLVFAGLELGGVEMATGAVHRAWAKVRGWLRT